MNAYYKGQMVSLGGGSSTTLDGVRICAIGDSNTQYCGTELEEQIKLLTGCASLRNFGTAGATWKSTTGTSDTGNTSAVGKVNQLINPFASTGIATDYDIITIMMGTNDSDANAGEITPRDGADVSTMCGAMHYCLRNLLYYYRNSMIVGIIPPQSEYTADGADRYDKMRQIYEYYSVPYLDFWKQGQVVYNGKVDGTPNYLGDGTHLSVYGKKQLYRKLAGFLKGLY